MTDSHGSRDDEGGPGRRSAAPDPAAAVHAAAEALRARGWAAEVAAEENGHHRVVASRNGFDVAVHAWSTDWRITFIGETPIGKTPSA